MKPQFASWLSHAMIVLIATVSPWSFQKSWAASGTWSGTYNSGKWNDSRNWTGSAPGSAVDLVFTSNPGKSATPALTAKSAANSIVFNSSAAAYTITGRYTLTLTGSGGTGIVNNGTRTETFSVGTIAIRNSQKWLTSSGTLRFSGTSISLGSNTLTLDGSGPIVISNGISGVQGSLIKMGAGSLTLSGSSSYSGATGVQAGKVIVSGSLAGTTAVTVSSGASLFVTGRVNPAGAVSVSGTLEDQGRVGAITALSGATVGMAAPDSASTGIGNAASLSLNMGAHLSIRLGGTTAGIGGYDQLNLNGGALTLGGSLDGILLNGYNPSHLATISNGTLSLDGQTFFLVIGVGTSSGQFSNQQTSSALNYPTLTIGGQLFAVSYNADAAHSLFTSSTGHDIALMAVPEPTVAASLLSGTALLLWIHKSRRPRIRAIL